MITNKCKLNELFVKWLVPKFRKPIEKRFSITGFNKPLKEVFLERTNWDKLDRDPIDFYWALMGQAIHASLENVELPNIKKELKIELLINGFTIVGKIDLIQDKMIKDHKTTSMKKLRSLADKKKWQQQASIYRWMYFKKYGIKLKDYTIINILLKDWDKKVYTSPIHEIKIHLWSLERTELFIMTKLNEIQQHTDKGTLPECSGEENWYGRRCAWCSVKKFCDNWTEVK